MVFPLTQSKSKGESVSAALIWRCLHPNPLVFTWRSSSLAEPLKACVKKAISVKDIHRSQFQVLPGIQVYCVIQTLGLLVIYTADYSFSHIQNIKEFSLLNQQLCFCVSERQREKRDKLKQNSDDFILKMLSDFLVCSSNFSFCFWLAAMK